MMKPSSHPEIQPRDTTTDEFVVERILNTRVRNQSRQYLVKWEGYSEQKATWEPLDNLSHCKEAIRDFHIKRNWCCKSSGKLAYSRRALRKHLNTHCSKGLKTPIYSEHL
jgi:hypothetical protein